MGPALCREDASSVAAPRDAATVLLLRDRPGGPEVFLLRRRGSMAFAAGMVVYPGGAVDRRDGDPAIAWAGPPVEAWARLLGCELQTARELVCAAVRETFEESGVLLAGPSTDSVVADVSSPEWEARRAALEEREHSLAELLQATGLVLRSDLLRPWARWVTPEGEPRRYDTRFFVAELPSGQSTRDIGRESDQVRWMRPADALELAGAGRLMLLPPTRATLEEAAGYPDVATLLAAADGRTLDPVRPRLAVDGSGVRVLLPGDPGYATASGPYPPDGSR